MAHVDDRWYVTRDGRKVPTARHGRGKRWQAVWHEEGRERTQAFRTKDEAEEHLIQVQHEQRTGQSIDRSDRSTVAEYARKWAASRPHGPRTARRVDSLIRPTSRGRRSAGAR